MASEGSSTPTASKSKQERIRDNQRRSRARRQEYVAELERRLNDCHAACREADLQRSAFVDLQAENARLRELLNWAGVSPEVVESFGRNVVSPRAADPSAAALRQLKPKYEPQEAMARLNPPMPPRPELTAAAVAAGPSICGPSPSSMLTQTLPPDGYHLYNTPYRFSYMAATQTMSNPLSHIPSTSPMTASAVPPYDWMYGSESDATSNTTATATPAPEGAFFCEIFHCPPIGALLPDDGNTVLCSVAKQMIEQFHPSPQEMEEIKGRLATAFVRPQFPEQGCKVNNHVLFQVVNSLTARRMNV